MIDATLTARFSNSVASNRAGALATLSAALKSEGLTDDGRFNYLTPLFLTQSAASSMYRAAEKVFRAVMKTADAVIASTELQEAARVPTMLLATSFLEVNREKARLGRLDGFLCRDGEFRFIEYNPMPGSATLCDSQARAYQQLDAIRSMGTQLGHRPIVDAMRSAFANDGFRVGALAIITHLRDGRVPNHPETVGWFLRECGESVRCCAADELLAVGDKLTLDGTPVDHLLVEDWGFIEQLDFEHPVVRALVEGRITYLNGCAYTSITALKTLFGLISDPRFEAELGEEVALARPHLPWSRVVAPGTTTFEDTTIDLLPFIEAERAKFVLKPPLGAAGNGVLLGWRCTPEAWHAGIEQALERGGLLQARIDPPTVKLLRRDTLEIEETTFDLCPFLWSGGIADAVISRTEAKSGYHNAAQGAAVLPVFVAR